MSELTPSLQQRPSGFVDLHAHVPSLAIDLKYAGDDNFVGRPIQGYINSGVALKSWLTQDAADAVSKVQGALSAFGLGLLVLDSYRPQRAVDSLLAWSCSQGDEVNKQAFFPQLSKEALFGEGYLIAQSSHSRGSTLDVTLIDLATQEPLDMGTCFDFFGPQSWVNAQDISSQARANRLLLQSVMCAQGFVPFDKEWWHFTLHNEPFPDCYFDFID